MRHVHEILDIWHREGAIYFLVQINLNVGLSCICPSFIYVCNMISLVNF